MKKRYIVLIAIGIALFSLVIIPVAVSAASGGDAFDGLREFFTFLYSLATLAYQGYIAFLASL